MRLHEVILFCASMSIGVIGSGLVWIVCICLCNYMNNSSVCVCACVCVKTEKEAMNLRERKVGG